MLRLGTRVRLRNESGVVIARTLAGVTKYDVRLDDGRLVKYALDDELAVAESADSLPKQVPAPSASATTDGRRSARRFD